MMSAMIFEAVHYICDEKSNWYPDCKDIERKITGKTKGIVVITPNNPTGSVYPAETLNRIVSIAQKHNLIIFSDEIYDKIVYDGKKHVSVASLADDILFITFNGLSKSYRAAGFRVGWMVVSGNKSNAASYIEGLDILASMRLCSNVPAQYAIQTALGGYQSINDLVLPTGKFCKQRDFAYKKMLSIPGVSCVKPEGALYLFPRLDARKFNMKDDQRFILDLLLQERVLIVQGTDELDLVIKRIGHFLSTYRQ